MKPRKNEQPHESQSAIVKLLGERLMDGVDLQLQSKQARWNVRGSTFIALRELFDSLHGELSSYVDRVAERLVQLGGYADANVRTVAKSSSLSEFPRAQTCREHVRALASALSLFRDRVRATMAEAARAGDTVTATLFTEIWRGVERWLWFVDGRLHLN